MASTALVIFPRGLQQKIAIVARDLYVTTFAAYLVLEDRTGYRLLIMELAPALIVHLGPSLIKKDQPSAKSVLGPRTHPTTFSAYSRPDHLPSPRQAHRHVDSQRLLLLLHQWYSFARADL